MANANKHRPTKDPEADCPTVEEYELRRRAKMDAQPAPKAPKP